MLDLHFSGAYHDSQGWLEFHHEIICQNEIQMIGLDDEQNTIFIPKRRLGAAVDTVRSSGPRHASCGASHGEDDDDEGTEADDDEAAVEAVARAATSDDDDEDADVDDCDFGSAVDAAAAWDDMVATRDGA